jgi:hypothetical protein
VAPCSRVVILKQKINSQRKFSGKVSEISDTGFTLTDQKTGKVMTLAYADVQQINQKGMSKATKIAIVVVAGIIIVAIIVGYTITGGDWSRWLGDPARSSGDGQCCRPSTAGIVARLAVLGLAVWYSYPRISAAVEQSPLDESMKSGFKERNELYWEIAYAPSTVLTANSDLPLSAVITSEIFRAGSEQLAAGSEGRSGVEG